MTGLLTILIGLFLLNTAFAVVILLIRAKNSLKAKRLGRIEAKWEPVLIDVINGDDPPPPDIPASSGEARHVLEIAARLARRLRGPDRQRVIAYVQPIVRARRHELVSRSAGKRAAAVELYSVLAFDEHKAYFAEALDDRSGHVSIVAARSLCRPDQDEYFTDVLRHLPRYTTWSQGLLAQMLASVGPSAMPHLRTYLASPANPPAARATAAAALRILRDPESVRIAEEALDHQDPELVVSCLRLIRAVGSSSSAPAVRPLLGHKAFFVRSEAATVLGNIGSREDVELIIDQIDTDSPWIAIRSARAILALSDADTLDALASEEGLVGAAAREILQEVPSR